MIDQDKAKMLGEAGFRPDWLKNVQEGDTVHFDGSFLSGPEEWTVVSVFDSPRGDGGYVRNMIIRLPDGVLTHRSLGWEWNVWVLKTEGGAA